MNETYFFDTYAIIEIFKGNPNYQPYTNANIILTKLNLFELYYFLIKSLDINKATQEFNKYTNLILDFDNLVIITAAKLKLKNRDLSMTDCIGYTLACQLGMKFLTGDKEFEKLDNVEYVK